MPLIKISDAFKAGADWISATVRTLMRDQVPFAVDAIQDVRDNDLEHARWVFVRSVGSFYRLSLSSTAADNGDTVLRDNIGRRYIKATSAVQLGFGGSGTLANRAAFDGQAKGFVYAQTDQADLILFVKESNTSGDWSEGFTWRGPPGVNGSNFTVDEIGTFAGRAAFDDEDPGFVYLSTDGDGDEITTAVTFTMGESGWGAAAPYQGPVGPVGPGATIGIGDVSIVPYGQPATVENVGTATAAVLDFGLPQGVPGDDGEDFHPDEIVELIAGRDAFDDEPKGFSVLVESDAGNDDLPTLYFKLSAASADWSGGFTFIGGGSGLPDGGTTGQVLAKASGDDGDAEWIDPPDDVAGDVHAATAKTTPDDNDEFALVDTEASNILKKITWASLKARLAAYLVSAGLIREKLTANRTYYVSTAGSDSNDGLTAGAPLATLNKARDIILGLDLNGFTVTVQHAASQTATAGISWSVPPLGGNVILDMGGSTLHVTAGICVQVSCAMTLLVQNVTLQNSTSGGVLFANVPGAVISVGSGVIFAASARYHLRAYGGGLIQMLANYSITGSAQAHAQCQIDGIIIFDSRTITLTGTPNFSSQTLYADSGGIMSLFSVTFSGSSATGTRYNVSTNAVINTYGGGASFVPGNAAGSSASGGQYA